MLGGETKLELTNRRDNVMEHIRKQYEKRARPCVLGTIEEPVEWATLGLGLKVCNVPNIRSRDRLMRTVADIRSKYCMSYVRFRWRMQLGLGVC
jgi:hypothetical protein